MADLDDVIAIGVEFIKHCYRCPSASVMCDAKGKLFSSQAKTPKLKFLPPTDEALGGHIKCAHVQAIMLWKAADSDQPPNAAIIAHKVLHGTPINESNIALTLVYGITLVTPKDLLLIIACKYACDRSCESAICSCHYQSHVRHIS